MIFTRNRFVMKRVRIYFSCDCSYIYITSPNCSVAVHFKNGQPITTDVTNSIVYIGYKEWKIYSVELSLCTRVRIFLVQPKLSWLVAPDTLWLKSAQDWWLQRFSYLAFVALDHRTCAVTQHLCCEYEAINDCQMRLHLDFDGLCSSHRYRMFANIYRDYVGNNAGTYLFVR